MLFVFWQFTGEIALLKSPRMIKESPGTFAPFQIFVRPAVCIAALTHASRGTYTFTRMKDENSRGKLGEHISSELLCLNTNLLQSCYV